MITYCSISDVKSISIGIEIFTIEYCLRQPNYVLVSRHLNVNLFGLLHLSLIIISTCFLYGHFNAHDIQELIIPTNLVFITLLFPCGCFVIIYSAWQESSKLRNSLLLIKCVFIYFQSSDELYSIRERTITSECISKHCI